MKFLVMSESEFKEMLDAACAATQAALTGIGGPDVLERLEQAEAACRAREVVSTQLGFADRMWKEIKK